MQRILTKCVPATQNIAKHHPRWLGATATPINNSSWHSPRRPFSVQSHARSRHCNHNRSHNRSHTHTDNRLNRHTHSTRHYWGRTSKIDSVHQPFYEIPGKLPTVCTTAVEAMASLRSNQRIFIHGGAATPGPLIQAMCEYVSAENLQNMHLVHLFLYGEVPFVTDSRYKAHFRDSSMFIGPNLRESVHNGDADSVPIFLSDIPKLFEDPDYVIDCSLIHVSPPDEHGYCSLGTNVDVARSAVLASAHVIGLINKHMPRTHGDSHIHISHFDTVFQQDFLLPTGEVGGSLEVLTPEVDKIGRIIADNLIPDRACLQAGIGGIADSVFPKLTAHRDLGIHTEMFSDGLLELIESGVVSNHFKSEHRGKLCTSFCMGSQRLYDFIDDNPLVLFCDCSYVTDTRVISANNDCHAINSCLEVDITGQVCADSIGTRMYSGIGGQMDFMRGAAQSHNGKAIMALTSTYARTGASKISSVLRDGAGVVSTRGHVQYIVTEYGYARIYGKTLRERARLLIELAHPDHKEELDKAAFERFGPLTLNGSDGNIRPDGRS